MYKNLLFSLRCVMSGAKIWGPYFNSKHRGGLNHIVVELVEDFDTNHFMAKFLHIGFLVDSFSEIMLRFGFIIHAETIKYYLCSSAKNLDKGLQFLCISKNKTEIWFYHPSRNHKWYFVTKIILTYFEEKLF